ncbi:MAG: type IV pilus secretin PilQ [Candidatus Dadabacteria bacterium]|nr:type IV pilus secretin PilQ [Candidatus Dadabacteria bacterium]
MRRAAVLIFAVALAAAFQPSRSGGDTGGPWAFDFRVASLGADGVNYRGEKGTFIYRGVDVREVLFHMAKIGGFSIIMSDDVSGAVDMELTGVPWDHALAVVLEQGSLGAFVDGGVIKISSLEEISKRRRLASDAAALVEKTEKLISRQFFMDYASARETAATVRNLLTKRGKVVVDERTNSIVVRETPLRMENLEGVIKSLDRATTKIMIESRIVQAGTDFSRAVGIRWGLNYSGRATGARFPSTINLGGTRLETPFGMVGDGFAVDLPAATGPGSGGSLGVVLGNLSGTFDLDVRLSALEARGKVKILSSPKILTVDGSPARIEQGISIPFSTVSEQGTKTEFADATLSLEVTPSIAEEGSVLMDIQITDNSPDATFAVGSQPSIRRNEARTKVLAADGETIVLGGIVTTTQNNNVSALPLLSSIPVLGMLFKRTVKQTIERELLLFITPRVVG